VAIAAAALAAASTLAERHCAFGFGGFQCNSPVAGWGDAILVTTLAALATLALAAPIAAFRLIGWLRAR
jgi:hypothetical protein